MEGLWLVSYLLLWAVVAVLAIGTLSLVRLVGQLQMRLGPAGAAVTDQGIEIGSSLPEVLSPELTAGFNGQFDFPRAKDSLLVFVSPNCKACDELFRHLAPFHRRNASQLDVMLMSHSSDEEGNAELARRMARARLDFGASPGLAAAARVHSSPYALWLDPQGIVRAKGIVNHREHLESLQNARASGFASLDEYLDSVEEPSRNTMQEGEAE